MCRLRPTRPCTLSCDAGDSHERKCPRGSAALSRLHFGVPFSTRFGVVTIAIAFVARFASAQSISPLRTEDPLGVPPGASSSPVVRPGAWNIDGVVNSIVQAGNTIYFGGDF